MTTLQKTNAVLPPDAAQELRNLRESSNLEFYAAVIALREKNWPLRAIAEPFGVTRVAAKSWHTRALQDEEAVELSKDLNVPSLPLSARGRDVRVKKLKPGIPPADQQKIQELASEASGVRRWTPEDSPQREAARNLESLVYKYVNDNGVSPSLIAKYAGVSRRAIVQRLEKAEKARA